MYESLLMIFKEIVCAETYENERIWHTYTTWDNWKNNHDIILNKYIRDIYAV